MMLFYYLIVACVACGLSCRGGWASIDAALTFQALSDAPYHCNLSNYWPTRSFTVI